MSAAYPKSVESPDVPREIKSEPIRRLVGEILDLVMAEGVAPTEAAERVLWKTTLLPQTDVLYCTQRALGQFAGYELSQRRRELKLVKPRKQPRQNKVSELVEIIEDTMGEVAKTLTRVYQGADGVVKPLHDFTQEDHSYRMDLEAVMEAGARTRKLFHLAALEALQRANVTTIMQLPVEKQLELAQMI